MKISDAQLKNYHKATNDLLNYLDSFQKRELMSDASNPEFYLKRTQWFLDILGNPEKQIPHLVHVTGTSGKGSVTQMIHEILHAAGKKVGSNYSPHPTTFIERIKVNDKFISVSEFTRGISRLKKLLKAHEDNLPLGMISFFEFMFCLAVDHFVRKGITHAVLEVGLGGRYDASNTIPTPDVSIITNIGLDHVAILGDTKEKIAWEKSGILKSGTVFLSAERDPKVRKVFSKVLNARPPKKQEYVPKPEFVEMDGTGTRFTHASKKYQLSLIGHHQAQNAILAIEAARALQIPYKAISAGLQKTKRPSCMEIMQQQPLVIIDGAHNEDKIRSTAEALAAIVKQHEHPPTVHCVFALTDTKDPKTILDCLQAQVDQFYFTTYTPFTFRKPLPPEQLMEHAKTQGISAKQYPKSMQALRAALRAAADNDIVLVTGSIMLVGELRQHWISEKTILERRKS